MESREEHISPDTLLRLVVVQEDGDIALGFDGFPWHTHGDVLAGGYALCGRDGLSPEEATRLFVSDVVESRAIIAMMRVDGEIKDVWVTDDPAKERKHQQGGEEFVFRRWDGKIIDAS